MEDLEYVRDNFLVLKKSLTSLVRYNCARRIFFVDLIKKKSALLSGINCDDDRNLYVDNDFGYSSKNELVRCEIDRINEVVLNGDLDFIRNMNGLFLRMDFLLNEVCRIRSFSHEMFFVRNDFSDFVRDWEIDGNLNHVYFFELLNRIEVVVFCDL